MFVKEIENIKKFLQEQYTDFEIMREKPLVYRTPAGSLIFKPVKYFDHPRFIRDLSLMITGYYSIFQKLEFLSNENFKNKDEISRAITQVTIFNSTKLYQDFVVVALPRFISTWSIYSKDNKKISKCSKRKMRKVLSYFTTDELIEMFLCLFVFNYDIVAKKNFAVLKRLGLTKAQDTTSTGQLQKKKVVQFPKLTLKPLPKSDWELIERAREQIEK